MISHLVVAGCFLLAGFNLLQADLSSQKQSQVQIFNFQFNKPVARQLRGGEKKKLVRGSDFNPREAVFVLMFFVG